LLCIRCTEFPVIDHNTVGSIEITDKNAGERSADLMGGGIIRRDRENGMSDAIAALVCDLCLRVVIQNIEIDRIGADRLVYRHRPVKEDLKYGRVAAFKLKARDIKRADGCGVSRNDREIGRLGGAADRSGHSGAASAIAIAFTTAGDQDRCGKKPGEDQQ
jgi:hypothetical protein